MAVAIGAATAGAFRLHRAADIERQTQRTQELGGLAFQRQDFLSRAETNGGVNDALVAERSRALQAANVALRLVGKHDPGAGARIRPLYLAYVRGSNRAFARAAADNGRIPADLRQQVERRLGGLRRRSTTKSENRPEPRA